MDKPRQGASTPQMALPLGSIRLRELSPRERGELIELLATLLLEAAERREGSDEPVA